MPDKAWKNAERKIAAIFGTVRIPAAMWGQRPDRGDNAPDAETEQLALQVKSGYRCPGYLRSWLNGIQKTAPPGKVGAVVWHVAGTRFTDSLVVLRAADLAALLQSPAGTDESACAGPDTPPDTPSAL